MELSKVILAKVGGLDGDDGVDYEDYGSNYISYDDSDGILYEYSSRGESKDEDFNNDTVLDPLPNPFDNFLTNLEDEDLGNEFIYLDIDTLKKRDQ